MIPICEHNMLEGQGKLINRKTKTAGKEYDRFFIYVPTEVARDGTFPFREGEGLRIRIDAKNKRLVIEKTLTQSQNQNDSKK